MATFLDIRTSVARSLWSEISSAALNEDDVKLAVNTACGIISDRRDWLWKVRWQEITTVADDGEYDLAANFGFQIKVYYQKGNNPYVVTYEPEERLRRMWDTAERGEPVNYTVRRKSDDTAWEIMLRPKPRNVLTVFVGYETNFTLTDDSDTNYITDNMEMVLRAGASAILAKDVMQDPRLASEKDSLFEALIEPHETRDDKMKEDATGALIQPDTHHYEGAFNGYSWNEVV